MTTPLDTASAAWGEDLPEWIETLALECIRTSQNKVAQRLDCSAAMISQVLRRKYPADLSRLEERVRGMFRGQTILCPALGEMPLNLCQDWRAKAGDFQIGNPLRTRMYRACHACPRFQKSQRPSDAEQA